MNRSLLSKFGMALVACAMCTQVHAVELLHWERKPLPIDLPVGQERVIILDRNVRLGLPPEIATEDVLRVQSAGGAVYLKAHKAFDTQRVRIQDVESHEVVIVDLTAKAKGASAEEIKVVYPNEKSASADKSSAATEQASVPARRTPIPVVLTRYAAQSLYAPSRTIEPVQGITRVAMRLPGQMPSLLPALPVTATPIAAWKLDGWVVTAVKLTNRDPARAFELDARWLQGSLYSATFMHPTLDRRGSVRDTTTAFIVTRGQSLAQALPLSDRSNEGSSVSIDDGVRVGGDA